MSLSLPSQGKQQPVSYIYHYFLFIIIIILNENLIDSNLWMGKMLHVVFFFLILLIA